MTDIHVVYSVYMYNILILVSRFRWSPWTSEGHLSLVPCTHRQMLILQVLIE